MGARRNINRYKTEPHGKNVEDVIKRAKRFFSNDIEFIVSEYGGVFQSSRPAMPPFKNPENARVFKRGKIGGRWLEQ